MKLDPDEIAALARLAESRGGRVLHMSIPGVGSVPVAVDRLGDALSPIPAPRPSKYRNVRTEHGGIRYDSKAEARRAAELDELAGIGLWYIRQPTFRLGCPENVYRADFLVVHSGKVHVEDVKGHPTRKFLHDVKLWKAHGPCQLWIRGREGIEYVNGGKCWESIARGTAGQSSFHKWSEI